LGACGGAPPPVCGSNSACKNGDVCVVGTCTSNGAVSPSTRRIVVDPEGIAYVTFASGVDVRSAAVALGASIGGGAPILAKFARGEWGADRVAKAYLVLERVDGAKSGPNDVVVRAEKILEAWSPKLDGKGASWSSPPASEPIPGGEAHVSAHGPTIVRIDV